MILITCGFCICESAYLLKFIRKPQITTHSKHFFDCLWTCPAQWKIWVALCTHSQLKSHQEMLCLLISALILSTSLSCSLFSATVYLVVFCCFLLVILLLKMVPKHSAVVLSNVPKCKKAVMCLMEKRYIR